MANMIAEAVAEKRRVFEGPPAIELRDVTKRFRTPSGDVFTALRDLTLTVRGGEFLSVVGPTGWLSAPWKVTAAAGLR